MKKWKNRAVSMGILICMSISIVMGYKIWQYYMDANQNKDDFSKLIEQMEQEKGIQENDMGEPDKTEDGILEKYAALYQQNPDMVGWISIEGTDVNYPVMQTPKEPDFYLKHDFEKKESAYGVPYVDAACSIVPQSDNLLIYGHHMKDGQMFGGLMEYEQKAFFEAHKTIQFDTLWERGEYEIVAVFKTTVGDESGFPFYKFVDAKNQQAFDEYVSKCKELALYETGVSAEYGDRLLTLSTCEYTKKNGRLVVVGIKRC